MRARIQLVMVLLFPALAACGGDEPGASSSAGTGASGASSGDPTGSGSGVGGGSGGDATTGGSGGVSASCTPIPQTDCEAQAPARCVYVSQSGDDAAAGTIDAPVRHIWKGLSMAAPGDFVYARAGTWTVAAEGTAYFCGESSWETTLVPIVDAVLYGTGADGSECVSSWPAFTVASGTADAPITFAAFPGEHVVLDGEGQDTPHQGPVQIIRVGTLGANAHKAYWTIRGFDITGGGIYVAGNGFDENVSADAEANNHHIVIEGNEIHEVMTFGGNNAGMIKIDRGDYGGPREITVRCNHIHHMRDNDQADWSETTDAQHFGAVTTLSRETYLGVEGGGTGRVVIEGNLLHDLPHAFFFKNPAAGPIEIRNNRIWNTQGLGGEAPSNLVFENNLVYASGGGFTIGSEVAPDDAALYALSGQNAVIRGNTLVGGSFGAFWSGTGAVIERNVLTDISGRVEGANWDTPSVLSKSGVVPDPLDPAGSAMQTHSIDDNCYVSAYPDFQLVSRYLPPEVTGTDWIVEHYDLTGARTTFGFDTNSTFVMQQDPSTLFVDAAGHDFTQRADSPCAGFGADTSAIPSPR